MGFGLGQGVWGFSPEPQKREALGLRTSKLLLAFGVYHCIAGTAGAHVTFSMPMEGGEQYNMQRELSEPSWLKSEPNLPLEPHSRGVWISSPEVCKVQDLCCDFVHGHTFPKGRPMKGNRMLQKSSSRTDQSQMDAGFRAPARRRLHGCEISLLCHTAGQPIINCPTWRGVEDGSVAEHRQSPVRGAVNQGCHPSQRQSAVVGCLETGRLGPLQKLEVCLRSNQHKLLRVH